MEGNRGIADADRQRVHGFLDREDVRAQLEELGVSSDEAHRRVAVLTDAEIAEINGRLDQLPAGGSFGGAVLGIALVLLLVLVITAHANAIPARSTLSRAAEGRSSRRTATPESSRLSRRLWGAPGLA